MDPPLRDKVSFFNDLQALHAIDNIEDDHYNEIELAHRDKCRAFRRAATVSRNDQVIRDSFAQDYTPRRTMAPPKSTSQQSHDGDVEIVKVTPLPRQQAKRRVTADETASDVVPDSTRRPSSSKRRATHPLARVQTVIASNQAPSSSFASPSVSTAKRKGKGSLKMMPVEKQIFRNLSFYYLPNNDVNAVRKARITKARQHGAEWTRELSEATHIIVDNSLTYNHVTAERGWDATTVSTITVVNEEYPLQCISYRKLINPQQPQYMVKGAPAAEIIPSTIQQEPAASLASSSEISLKLKPKHNNLTRWDYVPPDGTPSRSEDSSIAAGLVPSHISQSQLSVSSQDHDAEITSKGKSMGQKADEDAGQHHEVLDKDVRLVNGILPASDYIEENDELLACIKDIKTGMDEVDKLLDITETGDTDSDPESADQSDSEAGVLNANVRKQAGESSVTFTTTKVPRNKKGTWQDQFACMRAGVQGAGSDNPNSRIIELLQQMLNHNEQINDQWRTLSYKKAIAALKRHPVKIKTAEQARGVVGIGQGISEKIEEIVNTDRLQKLEFVKDDPHFKTLQLFLNIYGVGIKQAQKWIAKGYQTLEDLTAYAKLNEGQKVGIAHFDDLNTRIPRSEVEDLGKFVIEKAAVLDPEIEITIGGSYRRGAHTSGDIDFIITKKGSSSTNTLAPFLHELVDRLYSVGFLKATLSALDTEVKRGHGSKWHGCCALPQPAGPEIWRRIDFLLVPETELGAAMIYFTGDDIFNRSLRLLADKKGMRLNQRGLYKDVLRGPKRLKITEGELVEGRDERRIFEILGVKWREPHERWCT